EHDRSRYDRAKLREAQGLVIEALRRQPGPYGGQAAIAALHSAAPTAADTGSAQIGALYHGLLALHDTPAAALNRAAAVPFAGGPGEALPLLAGLAGGPGASGPCRAAGAGVLRRLGRADEAAAAYEQAIAVTTNPGESAFLAARHDALRHG